MSGTEPVGRYAALARRLRRLGGETEWVEYKRNYADPEDIGEYFSALANAAALNDEPHGYLLWGVEDDSGRPVGTTFDPGAAKKGNEPLETWLLRSLEPKIHFGFHTVDIDGERVVLAEIDRASHVPVRFKGVDYVRIGDVKKPLKDAPERERALWRVFDRTPFESGTAREGASAGEVLELLDHRVYFDLLRLPEPPTRKGIAEALAADGLIRGGRAGGWDVLNLGAILLARNLDDFPTLARKAVRIVQYSGVGRTEAIGERVVKKGYATEFERLIDDIHALLPSNEAIEKALRETVSMFPVIAVRELVANMLIHQDFSISGAGPMVEIFADRIEISNPGKPLIETDRFIDAPPRSRNEAMAALMRRFGVCEERGGGIDKAIEAIEVFQLPAPLFETPPGAMRVTMFAHGNLKDMDRSDRVRAVYLHACLRHVTRRKTTNATLRRRFGIAGRNAAVASRLLNDAVDEGWIAIEDPTAGRRNRAYLPFWADPAGSEAEGLV